MFPNGQEENTVTWLICNYISEVWESYVEGDRKLNADKIFSMLKHKYRSDRLELGRRLGYIKDLSVN